MMTKITPLISKFADDDAVSSTLPIFLEHLDKAKLELEQSFKEHDWKTIEKIAHSLKGSAGSFGFSQLASVAGRFEAEANGSCCNITGEELIKEIGGLAQRIKIGFKQ